MKRRGRRGGAEGVPYPTSARPGPTSRPHLQDPALPLPRSLPGDVVQSRLGNWTRSPSEPRGAPAFRDTVPPHDLPGLVVQLWRTPRPGASGGLGVPESSALGTSPRSALAVAAAAAAGLSSAVAARAAA